MRVTNNMLIRNMMLNLNSNLGRLEKMQQQANTGKKIRVPSDDPIVASRALKFRTDVAEIEQLKKNTDDALSWLEMTEQGLDNLGDIIHRARELTVQASNSGTMTDEDQLKIKSEITQLKKSIVEIGNTSYGGRYIFGGYQTDEPPFKIVEETIPGQDGRPDHTVEKLMCKGKILDLGGPVPGTVHEDDYKKYYNDNLDRLYGQPEIMAGKYEEMTFDGSESFTIKINDTDSYTISLTASATPGDPKAINDIIADIEGSALFTGTPPRMKVSEENGRLKFTVLDETINSLQINNDASSFDVSALGIADGVKSQRGERQDIVYEISVGNRMDVNLEGDEIFGEGVTGLFQTFQKLEMCLSGETSYRTVDTGTDAQELETDHMLAEFDKDMNRVLKVRADIGGRTSYIELTKNRLEDDYINFTGLMSKNEDVDMAEVFIKLKNEENVYRASLSVGARVIQPTLLDFIR